MKTIRRVAVVAAVIAVGAKGAYVEPAQAHLRAAPVDDVPWKAAFEASITNLAMPAPVIAAQSKGVDVKKGDKGDKGDEGKKSKTDQPVQVQVPDTEMNKFMDTLSKGCSDRFTQMLQGKGGDLHTFGTTDVKANQASCTKLNGKMCATQAHIIHEKKTTQNGRKMESTMDVAGDSCLPEQCMSSQDLTGLAQFMHKQAKGIIPGAEHRVELHVDCTQSGGTTTAVGVKGMRSGSSAVAPTLAVVLALGATVSM